MKITPKLEKKFNKLFDRMLKAGFKRKDLDFFMSYSIAMAADVNNAEDKFLKPPPKDPPQGNWGNSRLN